MLGAFNLLHIMWNEDLYLQEKLRIHWLCFRPCILDHMWCLGSFGTLVSVHFCDLDRSVYITMRLLAIVE